MQKLSIRLTAALIGFVLGVSATWVWSGSQTAAWVPSSWRAATGLRSGWETTTRSWGTEKILPYCEVARNGERYHNQIIRVKATVILDSGAMYIYEDCDPIEALMAQVDVTGAVIDKPHYLTRYLEDDSNSSPKRFEAIVAGKFNARFSMGCWGPKYHIAATTVELIMPAANYAPPLYNEDGLRMKHDWAQSGLANNRCWAKPPASARNHSTTNRLP